MDSSLRWIKSLDDDDDVSGHSYGPRNSYNPSCNSDSEYGGSISVRDMIRHYDGHGKVDRQSTTMARRQSHNTLLPNKSSSYSGLSRPTADTPDYCREAMYVQHRDCNENNGNSCRCCKNCTACLCCQNRSRKSSAAIKASHSNRSIGNPNVDDVVVVGKTKTTTARQSIEFNNDFASAHPPLNARNVMEKNRLQSTDSIEEANCHPIETSYQSKTTIAKTANGVRIIIDIFFDQEQCVNAATDVLGSRVETDIPQSRILNEFQQHATAATTASATAATAASATSRN